MERTFRVTCKYIGKSEADSIKFILQVRAYRAEKIVHLQLIGSTLSFDVTDIFVLPTEYKPNFPIAATIFANGQLLILPGGEINIGSIDLGLIPKFEFPITYMV